MASIIEPCRGIVAWLRNYRRKFLHKRLWRWLGALRAMLLRFTVENAFSFREEAVLNLVASADLRHGDRLAEAAGGRVKVLRAAGVYGANGHGKTKLVDAIQFCKQMVVGHPDAIGEHYVRFKLGNIDDNKPGRFVVEFETAGKQYEYGLVIAQESVLQEWLIELRNRRDEIVFTRERVVTEEGDRYNYTFGAELKRSAVPNSKFRTADYLEFLGIETPNTRSFLYEASDRRIVYVAEAQAWFAKVLQPVGADTTYVSLQTRALREENFLAFLNDHMAKSDTGIERLEVRRTPLGEDVINAIVSGSPELREAFEGLAPGDLMPIGSPEGGVAIVERSDDAQLSVLRMDAYRHAADGREVAFSLEEESAGTQRLLDLYPMVYNMVEDDRVYVVDEIDRKLHPLLAYELIDEVLKAKRGQLIFTTHTTFLLDLDLLRRDEIWFVQKTGGSSTLYSLASFRIRPDLDIRKGYLNGRFGAIPFVGNAAALGWHEELADDD